MIRTNYTGCLLAAHPKRSHETFQKSVMLIVEHDTDGALGHRIDQQFYNGLDLATVMSNLGIAYTGNEPIYKGGPDGTNRLQVVHTLDWANSRTQQIGPGVGISYEASILKDIARDRGPRLFRVIAGYTKWLPGHLEGEVGGQHPWRIEHTWSITDSTESLIFDYEGKEQWKAVIDQTSSTEINKWFNHAPG